MAADNVTQLSLAPPLKQDELLAVLDAVRERVVNGETLALVLFELQRGLAFSITPVGPVSALELAGLLAKAQHNVCQAMSQAR